MRDYTSLNMLIAQYMGYETVKIETGLMYEFPDGTRHHPTDLKYHLSLDWLQPVVEMVLIDTGSKSVFSNEHETMLDAIMRFEPRHLFTAVVNAIKAINAQADRRGLVITLIEKGCPEAPNIGTIVYSGSETEFNLKIKEAIQNHFDMDLLDIKVQDGLKPSDVKNCSPLDAEIQIGDHSLVQIEIQQTWIY